MWKKFRITVDGKPYTVTVEEMVEGSATSSPSTAVTATHPPPAAPPPVAPVQSTDSKPVTAGAGDVQSPVGGVVKEVKISVGQHVNEGDLLVVLEAMKMKTNIFSNRTGKVGAIHVKPGDAVDTGQALVTIG
ncbi:Pyruvate carboxyl transferase [invertebrate metagenome]|uniref:Pyruvate carboxyl transferase n=1 Tax=invertebrate metagenome TaxID=1711999 RepID=A0A484HBP5_9ZZZZ